jgi:methyl-accepting chemotaxis protein
MTFKHKVWLLPAITLLILAMGGAVATWAGRQASAALALLTTADHPNLTDLPRLQARFEAVSHHVQGALASKDPAQLDAIARLTKDLQAMLSQRLNQAGPSQVAGLTPLQTSLTNYIQQALSAADVALGKTAAPAGAPGPQAAQLQAAQETFQMTLHSQVLYSQQLAQRHVAEAHQAVDQMREALAVSAALAVLALAGAAARLQRSTLHALGADPAQARQRVSALAGGDLPPPDSHTGCPPQSLMAAADRLRLGVQALVVSVNQGAGALGQSAHKALEDCQALHNRHREHAHWVNQAAQAVGALALAAEHASHATRATAHGATEVAAVARRSSTVMAQAVQAIDSIHQTSLRIGDIISLIDGIAFQTKLLALNAAAEAARAGPQGQGFAAVAGQVGKLAQNTVAASGEIRQLIQDNLAQVEAGTRLVGEVGQGLAQVVTAVGQVGSSAAAITAAAGDQAQGLEQLGRTVRQLGQTGSNSVPLLDQLLARHQGMADHSAALQVAAGQFQAPWADEQGMEAPVTPYEPLDIGAGAGAGADAGTGPVARPSAHDRPAASVPGINA